MADSFRRYTSSMDRVRLGRVLGIGARQAAKTLMSAAEAATAPDPSPRPTPQAPQPDRTERPAPAGRVLPNPIRVLPQAKTQARSLKRSIWNPLARFSSVLWLEVTGSFFAIFAVIPAEAAWKLRGAARGPFSGNATRLFYVYLAMAAVFAYFAISSFIRARQRQRR